ncbi:hypothetical protein OH77DRAFT_785108 [Trametes cingulata]|nr:hypothetical protein OH77DRAFT_785108 [Trametes cingulata]
MLEEWNRAWKRGTKGIYPPTGLIETISRLISPHLTSLTHARSLDTYDDGPLGLLLLYSPLSTSPSHSPCSKSRAPGRGCPRVSASSPQWKIGSTPSPPSDSDSDAPPCPCPRKSEFDRGFGRGERPAQRFRKFAGRLSRRPYSWRQDCSASDPRGARRMDSCARVLLRGEAVTLEDRRNEDDGATNVEMHKDKHFAETGKGGEIGEATQTRLTAAAAGGDGMRPGDGRSWTGEGGRGRGRLAVRERSEFNVARLPTICSPIAQSLPPPPPSAFRCAHSTSVRCCCGQRGRRVSRRVWVGRGGEDEECADGA